MVIDLYGFILEILISLLTRTGFDKFKENWSSFSMQFSLSFAMLIKSKQTKELILL